jgi:hypothetical protein
VTSVLADRVKFQIAIFASKLLSLDHDYRLLLMSKRISQGIFHTCFVCILSAILKFSDAVLT